MLARLATNSQQPAAWLTGYLPPQIVVAMLQEMVEGGGFVEEDVKRDYMRAKATVDAVDRVISELQTTVQGFAW